MKRKSLIMVVIIGLASMLCWGCGNTTSTDENTPTVSEESTDDAETQEAVEPTETEVEEEQNSEIEAEEEERLLETVYLIKKGTFYDLEGNITSEHEYEYNEETGELVKHTITNEDGVKVLTFEREYYDDGVLKKESSLNEDGSIYISYEYNPDGTEARYVNNDYENEHVYTYENGVLTSELRTSINDDGEESTDSITYNEFGDIIREEDAYNVADIEFTMIYDYKYEYDSNNRKIKSIETSPNDSGYHETEYSYDDAGNTIKEIWSSYGNENDLIFSYTYIYEYDQFNNEIKREGYDQDNNLIFFTESEYMYDENSNIIKTVYTDENGEITSSYEAKYIELELPKSE